MIHESCVWAEGWQRWVFLPRRASTSRYNEVDDEHRGTNVMLTATEGFEQVQVCVCLSLHVSVYMYM